MLFKTSDRERASASISLSNGSGKNFDGEPRASFDTYPKVKGTTANASDFAKVAISLSKVSIGGRGGSMRIEGWSCLKRRLETDENKATNR